MKISKINLVIEDCKKSCIKMDCFSILENQAIYVTGGTGFMGKWIAEMISFINDSSGYNIKLYLLGRDIEKFKKETPHLAEKSFITLLAQDIRYLKDIPDDVNYIIHAAGSPDYRDHVTNPLKTIEVFYEGTKSLLDSALRLTDLKKYIHISSHQIYGRSSDKEMLDENFVGFFDSNSLNNCYGATKRISETLCYTFSNQFKLPIIIARPFAFIGPYQSLDKPWAINNFIRDGILGGPIRILGNQFTERSYLYASDMAYWVLKLLVDGKVGEKYNIGSNQSITLKDLAIKIRQLMNLNFDIVNKSSKDSYSDLSKIVPSTVKIVEAISVKETFNIDESICRTILWNKL